MRFRDYLVFDQEAARSEWIGAELAKISSGKKILDAGCGQQPYRIHCAHLQYFAQDFAQYDGKGDETGLQTVTFDYGRLDYVSDIWKIPEKDECFDAVLCTEVLEHVPYPRETLVELARLLVPGGVLIVTAPYASVPHYTPYFFCTGFHLNFFRHVLEGAGLKIEEHRYCGNAFLHVGQELWRLRQRISNRVLRHAFAIASLPIMLLLHLLSRYYGARAMHFPFGNFGKARKRAV